jgi:hypothetical protein
MVLRLVIRFLQQLFYTDGFEEDDKVALVAFYAAGCMYGW